MAILTRNTPPVTKPSYVKTPDPVSITGPRYRGTTVDTRYIDRSALLTHVAGQSWVVRYYNQQLVGQEGLSHHQLDRDPTYQQYLLVENMEVKVTTELSYSQNAQTKSSEVQGSAIVYPPVIPNTGDVFVADCGDGREGVFSVTQSQRLSLLADTVYEIEYTLLSYLTAAYQTDLADKTIRTVRFVKELLEKGQSPLLVEPAYGQLLDCARLERQLLSHYLTHFYDKRIRSLAVPGQERLTYDPFVVQFLVRVFNTDEHRLLGALKPYSVSLPGTEPVSTLWDAIASVRLEELVQAHEQLALVDVAYFSQTPRFEGIGFSHVQDVVYPIDRAHRTLIYERFKAVSVDARDIRHQFKTSFLGDLTQLNHVRAQGLETLKPIHPVTKDDYYVLSEAFYFEDAHKPSQLELLVKNMLTTNRFELNVVFELCEDAYRWGGLERFYYTPLLLALLRYARFNAAILNQ